PASRSRAAASRRSRGPATASSTSSSSSASAPGTDSLAGDEDLADLEVARVRPGRRGGVVGRQARELEHRAAPSGEAQAVGDVLEHARALARVARDPEDPAGG